MSDYESTDLESAARLAREDEDDFDATPGWATGPVQPSMDPAEEPDVPRQGANRFGGGSAR